MYFYYTEYSLLFNKFTYKKLNPTGRWRLEWVPYSVFRKTVMPTMFIEHRGMFFKKWIIEQDITEFPFELTVTTFNNQ